MIAIVIAGVIVAGLLAAVTVQAFPRRTLALVATAGVFFLVSVFGLGVGLAYNIGLSAVQNGKVGGYHQFLNGSLVSADVVSFDCYESKSGSNCENTFQCDSYRVEVEDTPTYKKDGSIAHRNYHYETRYQTCPIATQEFSYTVTDNFGNPPYIIASHVFAASPQQKRSDEDGDTRPIPGDVARGVPPRWQRLHDAIAAGDAPPVTVRATYDNYILGSESTILKQYSGDIDRLLKAKLLPAHTVHVDNPIYDNFKADKMVFVGMTPPANAAAWQDALMRNNAPLGIQRQGDMHVVVLKASSLSGIVSFEGYLNAFKAYSLNRLGKNALAKNGIILVLAVDDSASTIEWAGAATGMPVGNGEMLQALQLELTNTPFDVSKVFGTTTASITVVGGKKKPVYTLGDGIVPRIVMVEHPFKRACMGCEGKEDKGQQGFVYLKTEIPLDGWGLFWTVVLYVLSIVVVWFIVMWGYSRVTMESPFEASDGGSGYRSSVSSPRYR